ncbi:DUF4349 domain-containing protein [Hymenobacter sp. H14-R3]|uniref:DUF4349 domain-containing protein n=1 Tax=Hymenobacter sp. H14-R3 TaxID=3046308 RepID=UPI0024BB7BAF|nr:DUF4349 domain-containing protein [Hymenobacter sp. H14-R3]MDJ0365974.1 DUF4349 domain-containing protein [Hymenobacter sp. H14-R3]
MNYLLGVLLSLMLLSQTGCGQKRQTGEPSATELVNSDVLPEGQESEQTVADKEVSEAVGASKAIEVAGNSAPPPPLAAPAATSGATPAPTRLLIYHADIRLRTTSLARATARLDSLVRRSSGYLSASSETHADGEWRQETTIRVPPRQFQTLLSGLAGLGTVEEKKLSTDDVTAEHADVAARLQAKRAVERQYTALLGRAQKIKDILDIEEKLGEVRETIEATESRLKTLNDEVAYATITLTLYQPVTQTMPDAPILSLGSRAAEAFYDGWQLLISLLLGVLNLWPLVLGVGMAGWWLWRRRQAKRQPAPPTPTAAA